MYEVKNIIIFLQLSLCRIFLKRLRTEIQICKTTTLGKINCSMHDVLCNGGIDMLKMATLHNHIDKIKFCLTLRSKLNMTLFSVAWFMYQNVTCSCETGNRSDRLVSDFNWNITGMNIPFLFNHVINPE